MLAAGLASFTLGLLSVLTAASASISDALTLSDRVGDLSGLTTTATVVFFAAWAVLAIVWRHANPPLVRVAAAATVLIALGLLGTFPPFFNLVGGLRSVRLLPESPALAGLSLPGLCARRYGTLRRPS